MCGCLYWPSSVEALLAWSWMGSFCVAGLGRIQRVCRWSRGKLLSDEVGWTIPWPANVRNSEFHMPTVHIR